MKKSFKIILATVVVAAISSPYFVGRVIEKDFNKMLTQLNVIGKDELKFSGKFNRGFFSSTATTEVTVTNTYLALQLAHHFQHGPIIFKFNGWFNPKTYIPQGYKLTVIDTQFAGNIQSKLEQFYAKKPEYSMVTSITMDGEIDTQITSKPFSTMIDKGTLQWQGSNTNIITNTQLETMRSTSNMPLIEYSEMITPELKQAISIANIKLDIDEKFKEELSTLKFNFDSLKILTNTDVELSLQDYTLSLDRKIANNMLDIDLKKNFARLTLGKDTYGPFDFVIQLKNWNANAVRDLMQQSDPDATKAQKVPDVTMLALLANKITMDSKLNFVTPDGAVIAKVQGSVGGPGITAITSAQILPTLTAQQNWQVDRKIVYKLLVQFAENQIKNREVAYYLKNRSSNITNPYTMTPDQLQTTVNAWTEKVIAQLMAQNFIVLNGDNFTMDMSFSNQIMQINNATKTTNDVTMLKDLFEVIPPPTPVEIGPAVAPGDNTLPPTNTDAVSPGTTAPTNVPATTPTTPQAPQTLTTPAPSVTE